MKPSDNSIDRPFPTAVLSRQAMPRQFFWEESLGAGKMPGTP